MEMISQKSEPAASRQAKKVLKGSKSASKFSKSRHTNLLPSKTGSSSKKSVIQTSTPQTRLTVLAKQYYKNEGKRVPKQVKTDKNQKLEAELKSLRLLLKGAMDRFTVGAIRDIEAVKKPQRYQFFIAKLFRIFTELIHSIEQLISADENQDLAEEIESVKF